MSQGNEAPMEDKPTKEAKTAMPTAVTVAMRMPAKMSGKAIGNSTYASLYIRVMPMPVAASFIAGSTSLRPTYVF